MKILILGDVMGCSGRNVLNRKLPGLIKKHNADFVIVNGENAADDGRGITKDIAEKFFASGVDVITSGNHIWDKVEITNYIDSENRLLRPSNLAQGSPGKGHEIYFTKDKKFKIGVINLMGNVFMRKTEDVFDEAKKLSQKMILKKNVDFLVVDFHGEITSEKMAAGHFFDGKATCVVGTHTHVPTADTRILDKGTAYQTDIGMCGDYNSVIGMNKENSIKKFLKNKDAVNHFPAEGEGTISGIIVETNIETGLAKNVARLIDGGSLAN
jgi:metallophosphoesterase (TIGR00282 family)